VDSLKTIAELVRFELVQAIVQRRLLGIFALYSLVIAALCWSWIAFNDYIREEWRSQNIGDSSLTSDMLLVMVKEQLFERFVGYIGGETPGGVAAIYTSEPIALVIMVGFTLLLPSLVLITTFDHGLANLQNRVFHFYTLRVTRTEWFIAHFLSALCLTVVPTIVGGLALVFVNISQFGGIGALSVDAVTRLTLVGFALILYTQGWIFLTKHFARTSMMALILAVSCSICLTIAPWLSEQWPLLAPLDWLAKSRWVDGLWSENYAVFLQSVGGIMALSLIPMSASFILWKRRSLV